MSLVLQNTKNEIVGVFDENDVYIKGAPRKEVRASNLIHRATNIFVINSENKILVQTRSLSKEYCPGYLDAVVGGIVGDKEDVDKSAEREVGEEIGIEIAELKDKLTFINKHLYTDEVCRAWEYNYIIHLTKEEEGKITFKDHEVSAIEWFTKDELIALIKENKRKITGGSVKAFYVLLDKKLI